jgi:hypothetical protein
MSSNLREMLIENLQFAATTSQYVEVTAYIGEDSAIWGGVEVTRIGANLRPTTVRLAYPKYGDGKININILEWVHTEKDYKFGMVNPATRTATERFIPPAIRRAEILLGY